MSGPVVLALRLLLTISLYVFLFWGLMSLWRDIRLQSSILATRFVPPISLSYTQDNQITKIQHFNQALVTIGRDPTCELSIDDHAISARHARLSYHHNQWWLEDLASTNGTLFNLEKLSLPTVVISGDEFRCGDTLFTIIMAGDILKSPERNPQ